MKNLLFITLILSLLSCDSGGGEDTMAKSERLEIITELESKAYSNVDKFDTIMALSLVNNYGRFVDENPDDELAANYLFKAGDLAMALRKPNLAIGFFDNIINDYPNFEKLPYCMFLKGFVYEDQIKDLDKAKASYEEFIEKYPDHDMTEAAHFSIKNLGKSPEDLIKEFEQKQDTIQDEL